MNNPTPKSDFWAGLSDFVESKVSPDRWHHTLGVVKTLERIRTNYPAPDENTLRLAGYLHDAAKNYPRDEQRQLAVEYRGTLDPLEQSIPALWHAPASAQIGVEHFDLDPKADPLPAVAFHPTGRQPMTDCLQALMVADFAEPNRSFPESRSIRERIGHAPLPDLAREVVAHKISRCLEQDRVVHPWSVEGYNQLCD